MHLDKVYTLDRIGDAALTAYTLRRAWVAPCTPSSSPRRSRTRYDRKPGSSRTRAGAVLEAVRYGVRHVLAFADVDTKARLEGVIPAAGAPRGVPRGRRPAGRGVPAGRSAARPGRRASGPRGRRPGRRRGRRDPVDRAQRRRGARARAPDVRAGRQAHGRRVAMLVDDAGDPSLRTTEMLAEATARARPGRSRGWPTTPAPSGSTRGRPWSVSPGSPAERARLRQRPAHRPAAPPGPRAHGDGSAGRARPGRHRGRLLPVRPAPHARDRLPGRPCPRGGSTRPASSSSTTR